MCQSSLQAVSLHVLSESEPHYCVLFRWSFLSTYIPTWSGTCVITSSMYLDWWYSMSVLSRIIHRSWLLNVLTASYNRTPSTFVYTYRSRRQHTCRPCDSWLRDRELINSRPSSSPAWPSSTLSCLRFVCRSIWYWCWVRDCLWTVNHTPHSAFRRPRLIVLKPFV